jgi:hypothetical protein
VPPHLTFEENMSSTVPSYLGKLVARRRILFGLFHRNRPVAVFFMPYFPTTIPDSGTITFKGILEILGAKSSEVEETLDISGELAVDTNTLRFHSFTRSITFRGELSSDWSSIIGEVVECGYFKRQSARFRIARQTRI